MERENYLRYLDKEGILDINKAALVDFVAVGSVQEALQRLSEHFFKGYYFLRRYPDSRFTRDLEIDSLYGTYGDFEMNFHIYRYYYFLETVMSSYEPTFKRVGKNGEFCFYEEKRTEPAIGLLKDMHEEIMAYCREMFQLCDHPMEWKAAPDQYDEILGLFSKDASDIPEKQLRELVNVDEFLDKQITDCNR